MEERQARFKITNGGEEMSNKTECLRCGGGLIKRFDHYECVDCCYTSDDFHFEQKKEIERLREALEIIESNSYNKYHTLSMLGLERVTDANYKIANEILEATK